MAKRSVLVAGRYSPQPAVSSLGNSGCFVPLDLVPCSWNGGTTPAQGPLTEEGCAHGCWARTRGLMEMGEKERHPNGWLSSWVQTLQPPELLCHGAWDGKAMGLPSLPGTPEPVSRITLENTGWPLLCSFPFQDLLSEEFLQ